MWSWSNRCRGGFPCPALTSEAVRSLPVRPFAEGRAVRPRRAQITHGPRLSTAAILPIMPNAGSDELRVGSDPRLRHRGCRRQGLRVGHSRHGLGRHQPGHLGRQICANRSGHYCHFSFRSTTFVASMHSSIASIVSGVGYFSFSPMFNPVSSVMTAYPCRPSKSGQPLSEHFRQLAVRPPNSWRFEPHG